MAGATRAGATRALVEGALLAAVAAVLLLVVGYVPLGGFLVFLAPTPVVVAVVRHGLRLGVLVALTTALLLIGFLGPLPAAMVGVFLAGIGLPLGIGVRRGSAPQTTIALTAAGFAAVFAVSIGASLLLMGINPLHELLRAYQESVRLGQDLMARLGLPEAAREQQRAMWEATLELLRRLLPAVVVSSAFAGAFFTYLGAGAVLGRLGHAVPELPPFARWRLPAWASWAFLAAVLADAALARAGLAAWRPPLGNVIFLLSLAFFVHGLATAYYFLRRWGLGRRAAVAVLVLGSLNLQAALVWLGWLEPVLRLREWAEVRAGRQEGEGSRREGDPGEGRP